MKGKYIEIIPLMRDDGTFFFRIVKKDANIISTKLDPWYDFETMKQAFDYLEEYLTEMIIAIKAMHP